MHQISLTFDPESGLFMYLVLDGVTIGMTRPLTETEMSHLKANVGLTYDEMMFEPPS